LADAVTLLHDTIHSALLAALAKHGQSAYGVVADFDRIAAETRITGYYKLRFISEDVTKAVQAKLAADAAAPTKDATP
jgi:hypothetical protein